MFAKPAYVFKDGELVARDGAIVKVTWGATHVVKPEFDAASSARCALFRALSHDADGKLQDQRRRDVRMRPRLEVDPARMPESTTRVAARARGNGEERIASPARRCVIRSPTVSSDRSAMIINGVAHRRHVRRSLRHEGDAGPRHRAEPELGLPRGARRHRLRYVGHRLRLRSRHRAQADAERNARRPARAPRCCSSPCRARSSRSRSSAASANAC